MNSRSRLSSLIKAERAQSPSAAGAQRNWERLIKAVESGSPPMSIASSPLRLGTASLVGKASITFVVGAAVGTGMATLGITLQGPPSLAVAPGAVTSTASRKPVPTEVARPEPPASPSADAPDWPAARTVLPGSAQPARPKVEPLTSTGEHASTLEAELELVRQARAQLDSGNASGAWAVLEQHAERFPGGMLRLEREGLRVLCRCAGGPADDGQRAARSFVRSYPDSPLVDRVRRACKLTEH